MAVIVYHVRIVVAIMVQLRNEVFLDMMMCHCVSDSSWSPRRIVFDLLTLKEKALCFFEILGITNPVT